MFCKSVGCGDLKLVGVCGWAEHLGGTLASLAACGTKKKKRCPGSWDAILPRPLQEPLSRLLRCRGDLGIGQFLQLLAAAFVGCTSPGKLPLSSSSPHGRPSPKLGPGRHLATRSCARGRIIDDCSDPPPPPPSFPLSPPPPLSLSLSLSFHFFCFVYRLFLCLFLPLSFIFRGIKLTISLLASSFQ